MNRVCPKLSAFIRLPRRHKLVCWAVLLSLALTPSSLRACAVCYGQTDSPLAQGLNWGIFSLLVVVASVLGGFAAFFVYLAKRAGFSPPPSTSEPLLASARKI
jgi:hypothetical protein